MTTRATESSTRAAGPHPAAQQSAPVQSPGVKSASPSIGADERRRMIREVAYARYEQRGFAQGHDLDDWLVAEAHVDRIISRQQKPAPIETPEPELQQSGGRSPIRDETMKRILKQHPQRDVPKV